MYGLSLAENSAALSEAGSGFAEVGGR